MNNKLIQYGNRGMTLENDINITNDYYRLNNIALIYKKPTPIKVIKTNYEKTRIQDAFYEMKSTLDYNGVYKGKYIEFDAKETTSKTSFPLANIHKHQLEHMKNVILHKGIVFLIIRFVSLNKTYLVMGNDIINYIDINKRKSLPLTFFQEYGHIINLKYNPRVNYIEILDKII